MNLHQPHRAAARLRLAAASAAAVAVLLGAPALAHALPSDTKPNPAGAQSALSAQFSTLSGALVNYYAGQSGQTLSQFLTSQKLLLAAPSLPDPTAPGSDLPTAGAGGSLPTGAPGAMPTSGKPGLPASPATVGGALGTAAGLGTKALSAKPVTAATVSDLNASLTAAGIGIDTSKYNSLDALAKSVAGQSGNVDAQVTLAAAQWVQQLSTLHTPGLATPSASMPAVPGLAKDSLVFGLFADKSLASLVNNSPDLLAAAASTGLGTPALTQAWNASMMQTYASSQADFSRVLPDPCTGGMLAVMASGDPNSMAKVGGSCAPACATGGMYLNAQTSQLFSPNATDTQANPLSSVWRGSTMGELQAWQQQELLSQNPNLSQSILNDQNPQASASCNASAVASGAALSTTLPGVFANLRSK